jgi:enoyl-CoA hydratase/carnithine racemase
MTMTRLEREGGLAVLTLANPPLNQISERVVDDLVEVVAALEAADDVRALLVRGEGDVSALVPTSGCSPVAPRRRCGR